MSRLSLMTDYTLRMEVEALRQDLNGHILDLCMGRGYYQQQREMYLWKKARLEALEAFANAQRVIYQIDPRAVYTNHTHQRNRPYHRQNPYKREQKKSKAMGNNNSNNTKATAGPVKKVGRTRNTQQNVIMDIKEPEDDVRNVQGATQNNPLDLLQIKLQEEIKQEQDW